MDNLPLSDPLTGFRIKLPSSLIHLQFCAKFNQSIESLNFEDLILLKTIHFGNDIECNTPSISHFQHSIAPLKRLPNPLQCFVFNVIMSGEDVKLINRTLMEHDKSVIRHYSSIDVKYSQIDRFHVDL